MLTAETAELGEYVESDAVECSYFVPVARTAEQRLASRCTTSDHFELAASHLANPSIDASGASDRAEFVCPVYTEDHTVGFAVGQMLGPTIRMYWMIDAAWFVALDSHYLVVESMAHLDPALSDRS